MLAFGVLRKAQLAHLRHNAFSLKNVASCGLSLRQNAWSLGARFETTTTTPTPKSDAQATPKPPPQKFAFPERLCVYHAGTGRITFLACLKLSTLLIFVFFGFVVIPANYDRDGGFSSPVLRATLSAIVPMVFVACTTSPFVSFVHMRIPPFARRSEEMLRRYIQALPQTAELNITTMSFIAKPRVSTVMLSDLRPVRRRLGIVNLARDTTVQNATRPWYKFRAVGEFNAQVNTIKRVPWVWERIMGAVEKQRV